MTLEAQRIAIAEACGWKPLRTGKDGMLDLWCNAKGGKFQWQGHDMGRMMQGVPDYINDLNAMHEAEEVLSAEQSEQYMNLLQEITDDSEWGICHATAAQRAEAFLRTLNLWKETEQ